MERLCMGVGRGYVGNLCISYSISLPVPHWHPPSQAFPALPSYHFLEVTLWCFFTLPRVFFPFFYFSAKKFLLTIFNSAWIFLSCEALADCIMMKSLPFILPGLSFCLYAPILRHKYSLHYNCWFKCLFSHLSVYFCLNQLCLPMFNTLFIT